MHRKTLRAIVEGTSPVSLRVVDWFVTHYSKEKNTMYWISNDGKRYYESLPSTKEDQVPVRKFQVSLEYRAMLRSFSKVHFDPFRRHDRISFVIETSPQIVVIETTLGQLRFWQWALEYHVYEYIINHLAEIEASMSSQAARRRKGIGIDDESRAPSSPTPSHPSSSYLPLPPPLPSPGGSHAVVSHHHHHHQQHQQRGHHIDGASKKGQGRKVQIPPTTIYRMQSSCKLVFD